jgi:uncharacterized protein YfdQ (DUF2303 family)
MPSTRVLESIESTQPGIQAVIDLALRSKEAQELKVGRRYLISDGTGNQKLLDLATSEVLRASMARPHRKTGRFVFHDVDSFCRYVAANGPVAATSIWADTRDHETILAVLNGHSVGTETEEEAFEYWDGDGCAGWGDHQAALELLPSKDWERWLAFGGKQHPQVDFADFIESNMANVVEPAPARLMEIITTIQSTTSVQFNSGIKLDNGEVRVTYEQKVNAQAGVNGSLAVPQTIAVALAPYQGVTPFKVEARLRLRATHPNLTIGIYFSQPDEIIRQAFGQVCEEIRALTAPEIPIFLGRPGPARP